MVAVVWLTACGSEVETRSTERPVDETGYDSYPPPADDLGCANLPQPTIVGIVHQHQEHSDSSCSITVHADDYPGVKWTTVCKGTSCLCVENDVALCACETERPWCTEATDSCCPRPFP